MPEEQILKRLDEIFASLTRLEKAMAELAGAQRHTDELISDNRPAMGYRRSENFDERK